MPVTDDDIGRFDEGPLEVLVAGFAHVTEAGLAAGGMDRWDKPGEAGEAARGIEAIDRPNLLFDDDSQNVAHSREGLQELDRRGESNAFPDPLLELSDLELQAVQGFVFLGDASACLGGTPSGDRLRPDPAGAGEDVAVRRGGDAV